MNILVFYRHRLQDPDNRAGREEDQVADLGHGGTGAVPDHHHGLLPRRHGHHAGVRHHQREELRQHQELDPEHRGARLGRRREDDPRQQVRHERQAPGQSVRYLVSGSGHALSEPGRRPI